MALGARRHFAAIGELRTVDIFMALLTLARSCLEIGLHQPGSQIRRLMTIDTSRPAMRAQEGKGCPGMIKPSQVVPRVSVVAGFATSRYPAGADQLHPFLELSLVGIGMAYGAGPVIKVKNRGILQLAVLCYAPLLSFERRPRLMAICARRCKMPASQLKTRLLVLGQCERRRPVALEVVALFATVQVGNPGKLPSMIVLVTIRAIRKLNQINGIPTLWNVTLRALDGGVLLHQGIGRRGVFLDPEGGRLESLDIVTGGALALICPLHELAVVLVLVTVQAALKGEWFFEIAAGMTPQAIDRLMLAFQRILGLGVIETLVDGFQRNPFPSGSVMARLAGLLRKTAVMRIRVTIGAAVECQTHIARLVIRSRCMTLGAGHLRMQAA